jgi:FkbM family methyltransferase
VNLRTFLRRRWYDHFYRGGVVRRDGLRLRFHAGDRLSRKAYGRGVIRASVTQLLLKAGPAFSSFIEGGAHIGTVLIPVVNALRVPALAIEPVTANFRLLTENLRLNGLDGLVRTRQAALSDRAGRARIHLSRGETGGHSLGLVEDDAKASEEVEVTTLDACLEQVAELKPPYLVKLDIQGYEVRALSAARRVLSRPCLIVAECWPAGLAAAGSSLQDWAGLLRSHGLRAFHLSGGKRCRLTALPDFASYDPLFLGDSFSNVALTNMELREDGVVART